MHIYLQIELQQELIGKGDDDAAKRLDKRNKGVIFKNCAPFTDCISEINNAQTDNAKDLDVVMPMYDLIEYSNNYSKASGSLWHYCKDDPNDNIINSESFEFKINITGKTPAAGNTKDAKIAVPLKYLSDSRKTLEMLLINCEINIILNWSENFIISFVTGEIKFTINDTKLYVPIVTLSTEDNGKLLQQLKSGFKRTINWNKYQSKVTIQTPNPYLCYLIE